MPTSKHEWAAKAKAAIDVFNKVPTPADRVYVQIPRPPVEDRTHYEMVLGAEVLKGAAVDHTNLRRGRISLLPAHTQQVDIRLSVYKLLPWLLNKVMQTAMLSFVGKASRHV